MRRSKLSILLVMFFIIATLSGFNVSTKDVKVYIDNKLMVTTVAPFLERGCTMVSLADLTKAIGAKLTTDKGSDTFKIQKGKDIITLKVGDKYILINGVKVETEIASRMEKGVLIIPLAVTCRLLDYDVTWDSKDAAVKVSSKYNFKESLSIILYGHNVGMNISFRMILHEDGEFEYVVKQYDTVQERREGYITTADRDKLIDILKISGFTNLYNDISDNTKMNATTASITVLSGDRSYKVGGYNATANNSFKSIVDFLRKTMVPGTKVIRLLSDIL